MTVKFHIFDKTFTDSTGLYGLSRFQGTPQIKDVEENHSSIKKAMGAENLLIIRHVFSTHIIDADQIIDFSIEPEADAAVTTKPGVLLSVQSADCVPVLLASEDDLVIAAAHCSWHTAKNDILKHLLQAMRLKGASTIRAIIGPSIQQKSYEVDSTFYENIVSSDPNARKFFICSKNSDHFMFDLPKYCIMKLNSEGVFDITPCCEDTYSNAEKYYSYRRDTRQGIHGEQTNILSTIMITA